MRIRREIRIQPRGLIGCLLGAASVVGAFVVGGLLLWGLASIALCVALALAVVAGVLVVYVRLRRWLRRLWGSDGDDATWQTDVVEQGFDELPAPPKERRIVTVRRRPPNA